MDCSLQSPILNGQGSRSSIKIQAGSCLKNYWLGKFIVVIVVLKTTKTYLLWSQGATPR